MKFEVFQKRKITAGMKGNNIIGTVRAIGNYRAFLLPNSLAVCSKLEKSSRLYPLTIKLDDLCGFMSNPLLCCSIFVNYGIPNFENVPVLSTLKKQ